MLVSDYVAEASERLVVVEPDLGVREVAERLSQPGIDLVVVADSKSVVGVVTDNDIVAWAATDQSTESVANAESLMTRDVFSCRPDQALGSVVKEAAGRGLKHFPIIGDDGAAMGIIYVAEALIRLEKEDQLSSESLLEYIRGGGSYCPSSEYLGQMAA